MGQRVYVLDGPGCAAPGLVRQTRRSSWLSPRGVRRRAGVVTGLLAFAALASWFWRESAPTRAGERFVRAFQARNYDEMYDLFEPEYRQHVPMEANRQFLGELRHRLPGRLVMIGCSYELPTERVLVLRFAGLSRHGGPAAEGPLFGIAIRRGDRTDWHVTFAEARSQLLMFGGAQRMRDHG